MRAPIGAEAVQSPKLFGLYRTQGQSGYQYCEIKFWDWQHLKQPWLSFLATHKKGKKQPLSLLERRASAREVAGAVSSLRSAGWQAQDGLDVVLRDQRGKDVREDHA